MADGVVVVSGWVWICKLNRDWRENIGCGWEGVGVGGGRWQVAGVLCGYEF